MADDKQYIVIARDSQGEMTTSLPTLPEAKYYARVHRRMLNRAARKDMWATRAGVQQIYRSVRGPKCSVCGVAREATLTLLGELPERGPYKSARKRRQDD